MSDDLKRFRATVRHEGENIFDPPWLEEFWAVRHEDAADHIEELEAKLAKAADALEAVQKSNEAWRKNSIETWSAMQAMRDAINEYTPMPSLESDLLHGPESSVFCANVAEAVIVAIVAIEAACNEVRNEVYRRGQEDMRQRAADAVYVWSDDDDYQKLEGIIRTFPIKEKYDE